MKLYSGFDLHSNNCYLGIIDEDGKRIFKKKLNNEPDVILQTLQPFQKDLAGVVVESTGVPLIAIHYNHCSNHWHGSGLFLQLVIVICATNPPMVSFVNVRVAGAVIEFTVKDPSALVTPVPLVINQL